MALLQFKPAPMYILDEIDSALDLQHTQNIGRLFRTRFKGSQFIVVSLKEGLFKARSQDGTSIVERTQRSRRSLSAVFILLYLYLFIMCAYSAYCLDGNRAGALWGDGLWFQSNENTWNAP
jgi:hypothetical protein